MGPSRARRLTGTSATLRPLFARRPRAVALIAVVLFLAACSNDATADDPPTDPAAAAAEAAATAASTTIQPDDPAQIALIEALAATAIDPYSLVVGDCFNRSEFVREGRDAEFINLIPCDQPHGFEVYHKTQYPAANGEPFPGKDVMDDFAYEACYNAFKPFVGRLYETSTFDLDILTPTKENFEDSVARYRGITCWLYDRNSEFTTGTAALTDR